MSMPFLSISLLYCVCLATAITFNLIQNNIKYSNNVAQKTNKSEIRHKT